MLLSISLFRLVISSSFLRMLSNFAFRFEKSYWYLPVETVAPATWDESRDWVLFEKS